MRSAPEKSTFTPASSIGPASAPAPLRSLATCASWVHPPLIGPLQPPGCMHVHVHVHGPA